MEICSMVKDYDSAPSLTTSNKESFKSRIEDQGAKSPPENNEKPSSRLNLSDSESEFILRAREKLRLFDPEGVYQFRETKIHTYHFFFHVISILLSVMLIGFYFLLMLATSIEKLDGVGSIMDITPIDNIFILSLVTLLYVKLKKLASVKVTNYDVRYKLALAANAFNRITLNLFKFTIYFFALAIFIISIDHPTESINAAFKRLENGVTADSLTFFSWIVTLLIFIKAFKRFGKE